jgi:hypothetical protein
MTFAGKTYNTLYEVQDDLLEVNQNIQKLKSDLRVLAYMTEPNKIKDPDMSTDAFIDNALNNIVEQLEEAIILQYKLEMLELKWEDCHRNGLGVNPPDEFKYKAFIDGDFVLTEKYPTKESLLS